MRRNPSIELLRDFADTLPYAVLVVEGGGTIVYANRRLCQLLEVDASELAERSLLDCVAEPRDSVLEYLRTCARTRERVPGKLTLAPRAGQPLECRAEGVLVRPRSDERPALVSLRLMPKAGASREFLVLNQKIEELGREIHRRRQAETEQKRLLREAQEARAQAEAASRTKDEFLATVSHELRTPLNAMLGWARVLRSGKASLADQREGLEAIERNARVQARLIEDLLDVSRIVSGTLRLEIRELDLAEVLDAAVSAVQPAADAREIVISRSYNVFVGPVPGDPSRLQQVFWNLLSNAVKFTPTGGNVEVRLESRDHHARVSVIDSGAGISPDFLPHVFDRFRQADASTTRRHGGLGLGLSIVKHLVEMHGGRVEALSGGPGQGATFVVELAIATASTKEAFNLPHTSPEAPCNGLAGKDLEGVRVLLVDDEHDAIELLRRVLRDCGAIVDAVRSVEDAVDAIPRFRPHVLVSDIGMPDQDGYELIRRVRSAGWTPAELPAAALTAFVRPEDRRRALLAGFQTHLAKPVEPAELVAAVASLAGRTQG